MLRSAQKKKKRKRSKSESENENYSRSAIIKIGQFLPPKLKSSVISFFLQENSSKSLSEIVENDEKLTNLTIATQTAITSIALLVKFPNLLNTILEDTTNLAPELLATVGENLEKLSTSSLALFAEAAEVSNFASYLDERVVRELKLLPGRNDLNVARLIRSIGVGGEKLMNWVEEQIGGNEKSLCGEVEEGERASLETATSSTNFTHSIRQH